MYVYSVTDVFQIHMRMWNNTVDLVSLRGCISRIHILPVGAKALSVLEQITLQSLTSVILVLPVAIADKIFR